MQTATIIAANRPLSNNANITVAVQTARVIAGNQAHPNSEDISHLIKTLEKGWIEEDKFYQLLQVMLF